MRRFILAAALVTGLAAPAMAQNVASNNGIWWGGPAGGPSNFTFLNPITTMYGRIGALYSWEQSANGAFTTGLPFTMSVADGFGGVVGMGTRLMPVLRYELQLTGVLTRQSRFSAGSTPLPQLTTGSMQIMNELFLDTAPFFGGALGRFNPYLMGGIGISFNRTSDFFSPMATPGSGTTRSNLAWNVGIGAQYQVMNNLILDLGYRYLSMGRSRTLVSTLPTATEIGRRTAHQVMFSIVVPFDGLMRAF